jgi:hypothetical protein
MLELTLLLFTMSISTIEAGTDFPPASFPPTPTMPPVAAAIIQQNAGCCIVSSALSLCISLTPSFTALPPTQQASCLCYSSTQFFPQLFDDAAKMCADFALTAAPDAYAPLANLHSFCANIGNMPPAYHSVTTTSSTIPQLPECAPVFSMLSSCSQHTPSFFNMEPKEQASCLCYNTILIWDPKKFDNAVYKCAEAAKTENSDIYSGVKVLDAFCVGIGDIMLSNQTVSTSTTFSSPPLTNFLSSDASPSNSSIGDNLGGGTRVCKTTSPPFVVVQTPQPRPTFETASGHAGIKIVNDGEVVGISFVCALVLLFLC